MALASAKALLDELMGRDRNLAPTDQKKEASWSNSQVCKHFLVKFCPNDLFVNTKADLGICNKIHDEKIKKEYEESDCFQQMGYEDEFIRFCQGMLSDVERRIQRARRRLALGHQEGGIAAVPLSKNSEEKIQVLTDRVNELLIQVEELGCEGKVEEAQGIMKLVDQLKEEREAMRKGSEPSHWLQLTAEIAAAQEKQMEVCEVCGAFLIVGDAQQRVDDHLMGKQHVGYARLKSAVEEILHEREKEREERENQREKERQERRKKQEEEEKRREKEREERRKKLEEEEKKRKEKEHERYVRHSRSRDWERRRSRDRRSRSRERRHSHSSKEKTKHNRDDKERSRQRSRSRSREYKHSHHSNVQSKDKKTESKHRDRGRSERDSKYQRHSRDSPEGCRSDSCNDTVENGDVRASDNDVSLTAER
ncbi:luc7-like protein 3 isoform X2 [Limulus polyphemus]|uniref:Luc7-like protein 3 isoform X2 n=1 Tax=Limulus polyphemus TaxID=6850 RepID=A0ABM1BTN0_LIMPO|nr:luc7-like protein 3 isoform X2 [Limulus polyphemus]